MSPGTFIEKNEWIKNTAVKQNCIKALLRCTNTFWSEYRMLDSIHLQKYIQSNFQIDSYILIQYYEASVKNVHVCWSPNGGRKYSLRKSDATLHEERTTVLALGCQPQQEDNDFELVKAEIGNTKTLTGKKELKKGQIAHAIGSVQLSQKYWIHCFAPH